MASTKPRKAGFSQKIHKPSVLTDSLNSQLESFDFLRNNNLVAKFFPRSAKTVFRSVIALVISLFFFVQPSFSQPQQSNRVSDWLQYQAVPSYTLIATPNGNAFGFEWEVSPLSYSFGMTKLVSPWHGFIVEPPARFSGSVELVVSVQVLTKKIGGSYFGGSAQLLGHIPLMERGELLGLNIGAAKYFLGDSSPLFAVGGISTLFGIAHFNIKYSDSPSIWIWSLEFRIF